MKKISKLLIVLSIMTTMILNPISANESNIPTQEELSEVEESSSVNETEDVEEVSSVNETEDVGEIEESENLPLGSANITVIPNAETLEVGKIAQFQIHINVSGTQVLYENVVVTIGLSEFVDEDRVSLPQDLSEIAIRGVVPTYNSVLNTINYYFDELEGGFESLILLNLDTKNGSNLHDQELKINVEMSADSITDISRSSSIILIANQNVSLANKLSGILVEGLNEDRLSIRYNDTAVFSVGVSVNKFVSGTLALDKSETVKVSYTLADGLSYVSDTSGVQPSVDGNTYTWEFASDANENEEYFFYTNFEIQAKVVDDLTLFSKIINTANVRVKFIDGSSNEFSSNATVLISPDFEYVLPEYLNGGAYTSVYSGPSDALGNVGWINNDDVSVTDGALLGWNFYLTPLGATHPDLGNNTYNVFFHPDENINIKRMYSGDFYYRPSSAFAEAGLQPIEDDVFYSVSIKYAGEDQWVQGAPAIVPSTYYSTEEMGIDPSKKVETIWFHFHNNEESIFASDISFGNTVSNTIFNLPAGMTTTSLRIWTTVDEGYVGSLESKAAISYSGWSDKGYRVDVSSKYVPEDLDVSWFSRMSDAYESRLAPKTAQVVEPPTGVSRLVKSNIYFTNTNANLIEPGDNFLRFDISNDEASHRKLNGPFEAYALIGQGVTIGSLEEVKGGTVEIVSDNYKGSGKTLIRVIFNSTSIAISQRESMRIPVIIDENTPYTIDVSLFTYLAEDFEVSQVSNTNGTFTVKEIDAEDFNQDGLTNQAIFVTRNSYTHIKAYDYFGTLKGTDFENIVQVYDEENVKIDLGVFNKKLNPISDIIIIGTLPSIGDSNILGDMDRNSKFGMEFTGEVLLPSGYEDLFDVLYSTSSEPLITGILDKNTAPNLPKLDTLTNVDDKPWLTLDEISDFSEIRSYMIVKKSGTRAIYEEELHFSLDLKIADHQLDGEEVLENRSAYSSYAVGINEASVFETTRVTFMYEKKPEYQLRASNVLMNLSDVNAKIADGTFDDFLYRSAKPEVQRNSVIIDNALISMMINERPDIFSPGNYELKFNYVEGSYEVNTEAILTIVDDTMDPTPEEPKPNEEKPDEPKPNEEKPDEPKENLPATGVAENNNSMFIALLLLMGGMIMTLRAQMKKKKN